jgi:hypothetical protein
MTDTLKLSGKTRTIALLPRVGATLVVGGNEYRVRRVEEVNAYGAVGHRIYFDLNGRRVYDPMSWTSWRQLACGTEAVNVVIDADVVERKHRGGAPTYEVTLQVGDIQYRFSCKTLDGAFALKELAASALLDISSAVL